MNIEEKKSVVSWEQEKEYKVLVDTYKKKHKLKVKMFCCIMKHILLKIGTEATIYYLIQEVKVNRKQSV